MPVGWNRYKDEVRKLDRSALTLYWLEVALGWLITAIASLFGAPFWFDLLQRLVRLKSAGPSPKGKKEGTAAAS